MAYRFLKTDVAANVSSGREVRRFPRRSLLFSKQIAQPKAKEQGNNNNNNNNKNN